MLECDKQDGLKGLIHKANPIKYSQWRISVAPMMAWSYFIGGVTLLDALCHTSPASFM